MTYTEILSHPTAVAYKEAIYIIAPHLRGSDRPPPPLENMYKNALDNYTSYLDSLGIYRSLPKYGCKKG